MNLKPLNSALSLLYRNTHRVNEKKPLSAGFQAKSGHVDGISRKTEYKLERILTRTLDCTKDIAPKLSSVRNAYDQLSVSTSIVMQMPTNEARTSMRNLLLIFISQTNDADFHWQSEDRKLEQKFEDLTGRLASLDPVKTKVPASGRPANLSLERAQEITAGLVLARNHVIAKLPPDTSGLPDHIEHSSLRAFTRQPSEGGMTDDSESWSIIGGIEPESYNTSEDSDGSLNEAVGTPPPTYTSVMRADQSRERAVGTRPLLRWQ